MGPTRLMRGRRCGRRSPTRHDSPTSAGLSIATCLSQNGESPAEEYARRAHKTRGKRTETDARTKNQHRGRRTEGEGPERPLERFLDDPNEKILQAVEEDQGQDQQADDDGGAGRVYEGRGGGGSAGPVCARGGGQGKRRGKRERERPRKSGSSRDEFGEIFSLLPSASPGEQAECDDEVPGRGRSAVVDDR